MSWSSPGDAPIVHHPVLLRLFPHHLLTGLLVVSSLAVALVPPDARAADDPQPEQAGFDWEAFRARTSAQIEGLTTDWTGSMSGDISRSLEGKARLRFVETGNGRMKIAFRLGDTHAYYDGISIGGFVSCGTGHGRTRSGCNAAHMKSSPRGAWRCISPNRRRSRRSGPG